MSQPFLNMQALQQGGSQTILAASDLSGDISEFTSDMQRLLGQVLGERYKSLVISDATLQKRESCTYCLAELNRQFVLVEVNQGPKLKTKFEFRFSDRSLMKNGDAVEWDDFHEFQTMLNGVLEKVSLGQADVYKEKRR